MVHSNTLKLGDVIETLDGVPVAKLIEEWSPYFAASNEPTRLRDIARSMTRGDCGEASMRIRRGAETLDIRVPRVPQSSLKLSLWHDLPGDTFRKLSDDVAYLKLSSVKADEAASYIDPPQGLRAL